MAVPEWDFGEDGRKRAQFIDWFSTSLDILAGLSSERILRDAAEPMSAGDFRMLIPQKRGRGRPALGARSLTQEMIWELRLARWLQERYWPGRRRPVNDAAHPAQIVVARHHAGVRRSDPRWSAVTANRELQARELLNDYYREGRKSEGRQQAQADITYFEALPENRLP